MENINCIRCGGTGLAKIPDDNYIDGFRYEKCGCKYKYEAMNIPRIFLDATFSIVEEKKLVKFAEEYINNFELYKSKGIFFYGTSGTGKTCLSCCIMKELSRRKGIRCFYISALDLIERFNNINLYNDEDKEFTNRLIKKIRKVEFLVLDEINSEKSSEFSSFFHILVDYRYRCNLPSIYISNLSLENFRESFKDDMVAEQIISRIMQICYVINTGSKNFRIKLFDSGKKNE